MERRSADQETIVLVHSPLVGPFTWEGVAIELRRRGANVSIPDLGRDEDATSPFWKQHAKSVVDAVRDVPPEHRLVLVGHSGAGALLPAIGHTVPNAIAAYLFVDAHLPTDGQTRLGTGPFPDFIRELYASGGRFPNWTDEDLREIIPATEQRQHLLADLRPPPLGFWEESIPVFAGWPDAPGGYLRFTPNPAYDEAAVEARRRGWSYAEISGGHFHMLVNPAVVTDALLNLLKH